MTHKKEVILALLSIGETSVAAYAGNGEGVKSTSQQNIVFDLVNNDTGYLHSP